MKTTKKKKVTKKLGYDELIDNDARIRTARRVIGFIALVISVSGILSSCGSLPTCPSYGYTNVGTHKGYNSPYYRR